MSKRQQQSPPNQLTVEPSSQTVHVSGELHEVTPLNNSPSSLDRGILSKKPHGSFQPLSPVGTSDLPAGTISAIQDMQYGTIEFQNEDLRSRFIAQLRFAFPKAEVVLLCASKRECVRQAKIHANLVSTPPYVLDPKREEEIQKRFRLEQARTPTGTPVQTSPLFVIATLDELVNHDWGKISSKRFLLVTDASVFEDKRLEGYIDFSGGRSARVFFLDFKLAISSTKHAESITCHIGHEKLLTDNLWGILPYPTIRSVRQDWPLFCGRVGRNEDVFAFLDCSKARTRRLIQTVLKIQSCNMTPAFVIVSPTSESASFLNAEFSQYGRGWSVIAASELANFMTFETTIFCWTGSRLNIELVLKNFANLRHSEHQLHWVDIADHPISEKSVMPAPGVKLLEANEHRMRTYLEYGLVPFDTAYFHRPLGSVGK